MIKLTLTKWENPTCLYLTKQDNKDAKKKKIIATQSPQKISELRVQVLRGLIFKQTRNNVFHKLVRQSRSKILSGLVFILVWDISLHRISFLP